MKTMYTFHFSPFDLFNRFDFSPVCPFVEVLVEGNNQNSGHKQMEERGLDHGKPLDKGQAFLHP